MVLVLLVLIDYTEHMSNRRPQKPKLNPRAQAVVNRAGSNAAGPHRLKTTYTRKPKHKNREEY